MNEALQHENDGSIAKRRSATAKWSIGWFLLHPLQTVRTALHRLRTKPLETFPDCPDLFQVYRSLLRHPEVERRPGGWQYKGKYYPDYLHMGGACHAIFREALKYCRGTGIDVGAGLWPLPGATAVDIWRGPGAHRTVADIHDGSLDFVFSSHCLEHNDEWRNVLKEWLRKLRLGGVVFLYLPHPECGIWEVGSPFVGDGHKWTPTPEIVKSSLAQLGCSMVACDDGPDGMLSFWVCARREA